MEEGQRKKQDRKIAPLSLTLLYQYYVGKSREGPYITLQENIILTEYNGFVTEHLLLFKISCSYKL